MTEIRRVLWHSDPPWATSAFAGQTRLVCESMRSLGIDVTLTAVGGVPGGATSWNGFTVLPAPSTSAGSLAGWIGELIEPSGPDIVVTLVNTWRLAREPLEGLPVHSWTPIDSDPMPANEVDHFRSTGNAILTLSSFGTGQCRAAGLSDVTEVPHGIDTAAFAPVVPNDRRASRRKARRLIGVDETEFVIGVVAANNDAAFNRKSFPEIIAGVADFAAAQRNVVLYLHTDLPGDDGGIDLGALFQSIESRALSRLKVISTEHTRYRRGLTTSEMAMLYNSFDVLCAPSASEGFCLPLLEAQACGVPVVAADFAAQPENVGFGRLVSGQRRWDHERAVTLMTPSIADIAAALEDIRADGDRQWRDGVEFVAERSHRRRFEQCWLPILGRVA